MERNMQTQNRLRRKLWTRWLIPIILLLGILSSAFSNSNLSPMVAQKPNELSTDMGLDQDASIWGVLMEGNPTWALNNVVSRSLDGRSLRCAVTGGNPYSNVHCYRNLT